MAEYSAEDPGDYYDDVIDIVPCDEYDSQRAKLRASLSWILTKVYGNSIPKELQDPFYETSEGQLVLRPVMVNLMSSSELYCQACSNMFPETHMQWQGHWSIIQVLSRKGIYISEVQESAVTETVLVQTAPFRLKAHLALIDALMKAYTCEVASVEKVVKAVRQITTFPASVELPSSPEEALLFWVNKVCAVLGTEGASKARSEEDIHRARSLSKALQQLEPVQVPLLEDLMRDIVDGCCVAAVIAYYKPYLLNIKDLCLREGIGIADSLHNLRQIGLFCRSHLPWKCFHFSYEDLLYAPDVMKVNIIAFLADLFLCFEGPDATHKTESALNTSKASTDKIDALPAAGKKSSQNVQLNVAGSHATKRSFHRQGFEETAGNLGMGRSATSSPISHQPLLSKRIPGRHCIPKEEEECLVTTSMKCQAGRRAMSLCTAQDKETVRKSVQAWQDDQKLQHRSNEQGEGNKERLLTNVSIDSALDENLNSNNNSSLSLGILGIADNSIIDAVRPDYLEFSSVTCDESSFSFSPQRSDRLGRRTPTADQKLEPLMPALLKPTKEKDGSLSKAEERGDKLPRRRKLMSPSEQRSSPTSQIQRPTGQLPQQKRHVNSDSDGQRSQSPYKALGQAQSRAYEAFVIGPNSESDVPMIGKPGKAYSVEQDLDLATDISTTGSYTVKDRVSSAQAARAAGIPVVADSQDVILTSDRSREGSIASSGEYSDHESQKIHQEYKVKETSLVTTPETKVTDTNINNNSKSFMLISDHLSNITSKCDDDDGGLSKLSSNTTNFAELKRLKDTLGFSLDKMDRSVLIYMQSGSHGGPYDKMTTQDFKSTFVSKQGQGQHQIKSDAEKSGHMDEISSMSSPSGAPDHMPLKGNESNPGSLEMQQLRLKLEQKRKDIERKKHRQEAQQSKMRQQLGKAAFMRVVSTRADGAVDGESSDCVDKPRSEHTPNSLPAQLSHPVQNLPLSGSPRIQVPPDSNQLQTSKNSAVSADSSPQRLTNWRTQSQLSKGGSGSFSALTAGQRQTKDQSQPFLLMRTGGIGGSDTGLDSSSETSGNRAFSREDIQHTIDTVRNKWFNSDNDLVSGGRGGLEDEDNVNGGSFRLHDGGDLLAGARARVTQDQSRTPSRSHSQSPLHGISQTLPSQYTKTSVPITSRDTASPARSQSDQDYQVYDSSLNKLNSSLSELQGEIMRLSLQHEQLKAAQSPVSMHGPKLSDSLTNAGSAVVGSSSGQVRPIHGIPHQGLHVQGGMAHQDVSLSSVQQMQPPSASALMNQSGGCSDTLSKDPLHSTSPHNGSLSDRMMNSSSESEDAVNLTTDGFFVSFGDQTTPKRSKPKLSEHPARGVSPTPTVTTPSSVPVGSDTLEITNDIAVNLAGQTIIETLTPKKGDESKTGSSPKVGFIIKDEAAAVKENECEDEMQKKKIKLIEMQRKRKEEQEKKRLEKEAEIARKLEEKQLKEEEQEKKKAEEKARRDLIFQQYLQKKQEDEESPAKPPPKKRDTSASKQPRPKSMFVKSKAATPEPGLLGPDSGSSSQEDLTARPNISGRSTPSVMSALRSSFHFRLPQPGQIRKAVSCNILQGAANGTQGPTTYRRPPSPDLKLKQQRQRGSSQESGSETGSGSNPGSDYAGPKLFVKPSAKSNRHIIVNAISHCCLAGSVNTEQKNKVLEEMSKCDANHFLILFRDGGCQYRGLFVFYPETEEAFKIHGVGPKHIVNAMCEKFYKYNSGGKSFSEITSTKHLSVSVDAVVLYTAVWKSVKAVIKR